MPQFKSVSLAPESARVVVLLLSPSLEDALVLFLPQMACLPGEDTKKGKRLEIPSQMAVRNVKRPQVTVAVSYKAGVLEVVTVPWDAERPLRRRRS